MTNRERIEKGIRDGLPPARASIHAAIRAANAALDQVEPMTLIDIGVRRAVSAAVTALAEWQPIETAPVEGDFLVGDSRLGRINRAFFVDGDLMMIGGQWTPTHWMPLPLPPVGGTAA